MFRGLITLMTAFALLGHAVVGCCAHHAHASHADCQRTSLPAESAGAPHAHSSQAFSTTTESPAVEVQDEAQDEADGDSGRGHEHGSPKRPCEDGLCQFLKSAKVDVPPLGDFGLMREVSIVADARAASVGVGSAAGWLHLSLTGLPSGRALRDFTQVRLL